MHEKHITGFYYPSCSLHGYSTVYILDARQIVDRNATLKEEDIIYTYPWLLSSPVKPAWLLNLKRLKNAIEVSITHCVLQPES